MVADLALDMGMFGEQIHSVRQAPQSDFPQGGQGLNGEETSRHACFLLISVRQTLQQFFRLNIHKLDLIRLIKDRIRNSLLLGYSGYGGHLIVQAFNVLDIDRRINMNSGLQKFLNILIAL